MDVFILRRYEHMLEAWVSVLHETTNSFPDEFISKSAIQVKAKAYFNEAENLHQEIGLFSGKFPSRDKFHRSKIRKNGKALGSLPEQFSSHSCILPWVVRGCIVPPSINVAYN